MKREILFKGKDLHTPEIWRYGTYYYGVMYPTSFKGHYIDDCLVDENTIAQWTNIYDKKNKKVFEGDSVFCRLLHHILWDLPAAIYTVGFQNGTFILMDSNGEPARQWSDGSNDWYSIENLESFDIELVE